MLFKSIVMTYSNSLQGREDSQRDIIGSALPTSEWEGFRQRAVDDISKAAKYILDEEAAEFADTMRDSIDGIGKSEEISPALVKMLGEVEMPQDLVWMEHDHAALWRARIERGHDTSGGDWNSDEFGKRGILIDNRSPDALKCMVFRNQGPGSKLIIDPTLEIHFKKTDGAAGSICFSEYEIVIHDHMPAFYTSIQISQSDFDDILKQDLNDVSYDMAIPFMVFAAMASKGAMLDLRERESFTGSEVKSARKFGKSWFVEEMRSHLTIHIGPTVRKHLEERKRRLDHEHETKSGRGAPIEHWVSEHERHYKSGKIVTVKAHKRGSDGDRDLPRVVKGPRSGDQG